MSKRLSAFRFSEIRSVKYLILICCFFICGAVIGACSAASIDVNSAVAALDSSIKCDNVFDSFISLTKFHLLSIVMGMMLFGFVAIPLLSAVRGFFLAFTSSCFIISIGGSPITLSFFYFFVVQFVSVLLLLFLMNAAMYMSLRLTSCFFSGGSSIKKIFTFNFLRPVIISLLLLFVIALILFYFG